MIEKIYLQELFEKRKSSDKKRRHQPQIIRKYKHCINILQDADGIEDIVVIDGLN